MCTRHHRYNDTPSSRIIIINRHVFDKGIPSSLEPIYEPTFLPTQDTTRLIQIGNFKILLKSRITQQLRNPKTKNTRHTGYLRGCYMT